MERDKNRLINYEPSKERILSLKKSISELEDFFSIDRLIDIQLDYRIEFNECKKAGVDMKSRINRLELYHANLLYYYNKI